MPPSQASTCSDSGSRPGLTSLIQTGRGVMTVQTEVVGDPARLVTIVDFRGRVLKSWKSSFLVDPGDLDEARKWHRGVADEVRENLARVARRSDDRSASVGAVLFVEAMRAHAVHDAARAGALLSACARLLPGDQRVGAGLARLQSVN